MPSMLASEKGPTSPSPPLTRAAAPGFPRLVQLMQEAQLAGALQFRIQHPDEPAESSVLVFGPSEEPQIAAKGREIRKLLRLRPDLKEISVYYGGYFGNDNENRLANPPLLPSMLEIPSLIRGPSSYVTEGKTAHGS